MVPRGNVLRGSQEEQKSVSVTEVAAKLRIDYLHGIKDQNQKALADLTSLLARVASQGFDLNSVYADCANMITKNFGISSVAIAAWTPAAQSYKFKIVTGVRSEGLETYKQLVYTRKDVFDESIYPSHSISDQTKLYLTEDHPFAPGQESTFLRPGLLGMRRRSATEALEADYLCTYFYGSKKEILGWIESSGTRLGKLPEVATIRWIELAAHILGVATTLRG